MQTASLILKKSALYRTRFTMKFTTSTLSLAAFVSSAAWLHLPSTAQAWITPSLQCHSGRICPCSTSTVKAAVVTDDEMVESSALDPKGKPIAEGTIVSRFPDGLTAVQINDEFESDSNTESPSVLNPIAQEVAQASSSSTISGDYLGRNVVFPNGSVGVVVAHRPPLVFVYSDKDKAEEKEGAVKILNSMASVSVSSDSSVVDAFGRTPEQVDNLDDKSDMTRAMFAPIPQIKDIALINDPCLTGVTMIDTLAPIGRGQNMLLIGHDLSEMRGFAVDFVKTQCLEENTKCIYAAVDDRDDVLERLQAACIQDAVHVVAPTSSEGKDEVSKAAEAVAIAGTACAIGESYALEQGMHSVVIIDTIDLHKKLWDATTRVLVDVFGVEAVVQADRSGGASSEMRAFYSSLMQRAGQYKSKRGGGSVTLMVLTTIPRVHSDDGTVFSESDFEHSSAKVKERIKLLVQKNIPLTSATLRKIDIPVPSASEGERRLALQHMDDLISMSDGQIWLDERLEAAGQRPPMDPQRSVTRIGIGADTQSRADAKAFRELGVSSLRLDLAQAASMEGAEATNASIKQTRKQKALLLAMHQPSGSGGRRLSESCVALLGASEGHLDDAVDSGALAGTEQGEKIMNDLLKHVQSVAPDAMSEIDQCLDITKEVRGRLEDAIASFFEQSS